MQSLNEQDQRTGSLFGGDGNIHSKFDIFLDVPKLEPVPLSIRGTIEAPKIYPNVKKITKKQSEEVINSLIQYGLNSLQEAQGSSNAAAEGERTTKKQSFGSLLKDSLKNGLLESPPTETTP